MTLVKAQVDASVAVLGRYGIGGNNLEEIVNAIADAIEANKAVIDNTLPTPPPTPDNTLPGGPPPTAGTPLPTPPVFPGQPLPTPPPLPDISLPVPPPVGPGSPDVPDQSLPANPNFDPDLNPDIDLPEHAEPKGKHKK